MVSTKCKNLNKKKKNKETYTKKSLSCSQQKQKQGNTLRCYIAATPVKYQTIYVLYLLRVCRSLSPKCSSVCHSADLGAPAQKYRQTGMTEAMCRSVR